LVALVARRKREADAAGGRVDHRRVERGADAAAEAHVGDVARTAVLRDIVDAGDHARGGAAAAAVEDANRDHRSARSDADHADRVVERRDGARDVGAVAVLVVGRGVADEAAAAAVSTRGPGGELDARVDHPGGGEGAGRAAADAGDAPGGFLRAGRRRRRPAGAALDRAVGEDLVLLAIFDVGIGGLDPLDRLVRHVGGEALDGDAVDVLDLGAAGLAARLASACALPRLTLPFLNTQM
jgi:hypothetical protein